MASPSRDSNALRFYTDEEALAFVDLTLGPSSSWGSALVGYRFASDFQADWKAQIGHWLLQARDQGYLTELVTRTVARANHPNCASATRDPNDTGHLILVQELAPAMVGYYLSRTGWSFHAWEPPSPRGTDIDVQLTAPDGTTVSIQVKAPDRPGRVVNRKIQDGENDDVVVQRTLHAAGQLPRPACTASLIAVCAHRRLSFSQHPNPLLSELYGSTYSTAGREGVFLPDSKRGRFFSADWDHIGAVMLLDFIRGADRQLYACTVLINPGASSAARCSAGWFPHARVCQLDGDTFRWTPEAPEYAFYLPDGTKTVRG